MPKKKSSPLKGREAERIAIKLNTTKEEIKNERTTDETSLPSAGEKGKGSEENNAATSGTEETKGANRAKSIK